jgi:hypothetical protein
MSLNAADEIKFREIQYPKILTESSSFQLVRTNPKLTGNIKLTVSEDGGMWLDAIKVNPELAKDLYSKVPIDPTQSHPANIFRFLNSGSTPNEIIFEVKGNVDLTKTSKDFKDQYDFSDYFSGARYLTSNKYSQRLSYFAPLYLKSEIPQYFIIFKISDPANFPLDQIKEQYESGENKTSYLIDLFKKASIIKTFDIGPSSIPGKYLRDYIASPNFPTSPLTVNYEEDDFTLWNGILINEGKFGSRGELLNSLYTSSQPLKFFEENITNGYSRNGIIFPNIINLEFIFNDDTSNKYDFNRYFGVYVNAIDLATLEIDLDTSYATRSTWENIPKFKKPILDTDEIKLIQSNPNGVIFPYKNSTLNLSEFNNSFKDSDSLYVNYIKDKDGKLYMPKSEDAIAPIYTEERSISLVCSKFRAVKTAELISAGTGYSVLNNVLTSTPTSFPFPPPSGLTIDILSILPGGSDEIESFVIKDGGEWYSAGSIATIQSGNSDAQLLITEIETSTIINVTLLNHGFQTGDLVVINAQDPQFSGEFIISIIDSNNFQYELLTPPTSPSSSGTLKKELSIGTIRLSNTKIDLGLFFGQERSLFLQDQGFTTKVEGKSHAVIKLNQNLVNYDEIRIYHPGGTQSDPNGKFDLITATQLYPLIPNPGDYYVYNDYDNITGFDIFYFNSGGTLEQSAQALASCINGIRSSFTAYAYGDRIFIKLNPAGDFDQIYQISFNSPALNYSAVTINSLYSNSELIGKIFNFIGGSPEKGNRLIIDSGHLDKITQNLDKILVKSSDSWSKIRKVSPYIDEITETNSTTQISRAKALYNYDSKIAIVLDENETPTILNREFLMKFQYIPKFGLLSFYLIKDLDFDFYSSQYSNFPNIDAYEYYYVPPGLNLLQTGVQYKRFGRGAIAWLSSKGSGYSTQLGVPTVGGSGTGLTLNIFSNSLGEIEKFEVAELGSGYLPGDVIGISNGSGGNITIPSTSIFITPFDTSYAILEGTPFVTQFIDSGLSTLFSSPINDEDQELQGFEGFSLLKNPELVVPSSQTLEYTLQQKYLNGISETEYDFYKENESLDFATRSKIIPYITKWGIKNGKDSRDNPYRLNTEIVFGRNNFSPDHEDYTQNPVNFTHEWFYIESSFSYVNDNTTRSQNTNYFDTPLDLDKLLTDPNYFEDYFTYTPTSTLGKEIGETQFRYSNLYQNGIGQWEAFFKGFKVNFSDVTDSQIIGENGKPVAKSTTDRFKDYRFSCILKPVEEDINDQTKPPIRYRVIEHQDWKFIVVVIEVFIGSRSSINTYWESLAAISDKVTNSTFNTEIIPSFPYYDSINGDYRILFNQEGVSNLTHTLLYSLKNKKYNKVLERYSNTKMGSKLNITSSGFNPSDLTIKILPNIFTPRYIGSLQEDIINPLESTPVFIKDQNALTDLFLTGAPPAIPPDELRNPIILSLENFVQVDGQVRLVDKNLTVTGIVPTGVFSIISQFYSFKVLTGGKGHFEKIFEKISFAKFKKYINSPINGIIEYFSYRESSTPGQSVLVQTPNYYLDIPDISKIRKENQLITIPTNQIPIQFSGQENIGTEYEVAQLPVKYELNRYRGEFEPIFQNYSTYFSSFIFRKNAILELKLSNTRFNSTLDKFLTLKNFNHIKIADSQILELESSDAFLPIYPKIDEIAIGKEDLFLLKGNWDWGFHFKYLNKNTYLPVSGALRVEEDIAFISKLIALPENIELDNFIVDPAQESDPRTLDISNSEVIIRETPIAVEGVINLTNVITRFLINDGIAAKFNQYLINSNEFIGNFNSISDLDPRVTSYVREYIKLNILKLYEIDIIEFYAKSDTSIQSQNEGNPNSISFINLNDQQRFRQGYTLLKSVQINKQDKLILQFSFSKKQGSGLSISPKIKIKFI